MESGGVGGDLTSGVGIAVAAEAFQREAEAAEALEGEAKAAEEMERRNQSKRFFDSIIPFSPVGFDFDQFHAHTEREREREGVCV